MALHILYKYYNILCTYYIYIIYQFYSMGHTVIKKSKEKKSPKKSLGNKR